jgi:ATP-binding cassette subfamily B protein
LTELRQQLGFVQDAQLFSGTIKTIYYLLSPMLQTKKSTMYYKNQLVKIYYYEQKMAYITIGEGGIKVSGGENNAFQLHVLYLRKPRLLLFDEATSATRLYN